MNPQGPFQAKDTQAPPIFPRYRWVILAVSALAHAAIVMAAMALAPLAPFLLGDLAASRSELGLMVSVLLVGGAVGSTPGGWLADRSVRWTLLGGQVLLGTMMLLFTRSTSFQASLIPLFLGGLGFGALITTVTRAVACWFPARERATALGIATAAAPLGNAVASASMPFMAEAWGWRMALLPAAILVIATGAASSFLYRTSPEDMVLGRREQQSKAGPWHTLKKRDIWLIGLAAILISGAEHSFRTYFLLHLRDVALLPVVLGGWYLALSFFGGLFGRIGWGVVSDHWFGGRREKVFAAIPGVAALALLMLGLGWGSPWILPLLAIVFGFSGLGWVGIWAAMLSERASSGSAGGEIGLGMTFAYVGVVLGPTLFGRGLDLTGSYQTMWLMAAAVAAVGGLAPLFLKGTGSRV